MPLVQVSNIGFKKTSFRQVVNRALAYKHCSTTRTLLSPDATRITKLHDSLTQNSFSFRKFSSSKRVCIELRFKADVEQAYSVLGVDSDCDISEIRDAYLNLAKKYHPDGGSASADPRKFSQIKEAYKSILDSKKGGVNEEEDFDDPDKYIYDIKHTVPQHRQYLTYEGIGFGSPGHRQKQYEQYKVWKAATNIQEHRMQKLSAETETSLAIQERKHAQKAKISNAIERIVEDLIQESMNKGDFANLAGSGKPLEYVDRNPHVDSATHNLNKLLINNGFTPEWITLQAEIRSDIKEGRQKLAVLSLKLESHPADIEKKWQKECRKYQILVDNVNEKIDKYNMIVPFIDKQFAHFMATRDIDRILTSCEKYLPSAEEIETIYNANYMTQEELYVNTVMNSKTIKWSQVWNNIKQVFRST